MNNVLEVLHRPRQTVNARDDQRVTFVEKGEKRCKLGAPRAAGPGHLLFTDELTSGYLQRITLNA